MYDSLLYGNGLTIAINYKIYNYIKNKKDADYLFVNNFIKDYLSFPEHKYICRNFRKTFNTDTNKYEHIYRNNKKFLQPHINEISSLGIEIWISKYIFEYTNDELKLIKPILYSLYNFWYSFIFENFLQVEEVRKELKRISSIIKSKVNGYIYTLNFDSYLDNFLFPQHIHGTFKIPYKNFKQIVLVGTNDGTNFEYTYLFGGNGLEKGLRLDKINKINSSEYNLSFLFGDLSDINLGNLLIYGVSFGRSYIMSDKFLEVYPEHKDIKLVKSVDGHILLRLNVLYKNQKLDNITIAYYSEEDLEYYKNYFNNEPINEIIEYKHTSEIFQF